MRPSALFYILFVAAAVLLALLERVWALRHEGRLEREGAAEVAPWVLALMVPVYAAVFPAAVLEHLALERRPPAWLALSMVALFAAAKGLKAWAIVHLGPSWTMRVLIPPGPLPVAAGGPYRFLRHPNYVAVVLEIVALPLAGGAWITAAGALLLFAPLLIARVRTEEAALLARPEYAAAMGKRRRFLPGRPPAGDGA